MPSLGGTRLSPGCRLTLLGHLLSPPSSLLICLLPVAQDEKSFERPLPSQTLHLLVPSSGDGFSLKSPLFFLSPSAEGLCWTLPWVGSQGCQLALELGPSLAPAGWMYFLQTTGRLRAGEPAIPGGPSQRHRMPAGGPGGDFLLGSCVSSGFCAQGLASMSSFRVVGQEGTRRLRRSGFPLPGLCSISSDRASWTGDQSLRGALGRAGGEDNELRAVCNAWKLPGRVF